MNVILILAIISIVTTTASIYSSVALDTRRRRKEMALRKVNGAKTSDICKVFVRAYATVLAVSIALSFSIVLICGSALNNLFPNDYAFSAMPPYCYWISVLFVTAVTALTISFRILDVMRVDPVSYLKE